MEFYRVISIDYTYGIIVPLYTALFSRHFTAFTEDTALQGLKTQLRLQPPTH